MYVNNNRERLAIVIISGTCEGLLLAAENTHELKELRTGNSSKLGPQ